MIAQSDKWFAIVTGLEDLLAQTKKPSEQQRMLVGIAQRSRDFLRRVIALEAQVKQLTEERDHLGAACIAAENEAMEQRERAERAEKERDAAIDAAKLHAKRASEAEEKVRVLISALTGVEVALRPPTGNLQRMSVAYQIARAALLDAEPEPKKEGEK